MTREDRELLLKDLCARLPYKVMVHIRYNTKEPCYGELTLKDIQLFIDYKIETIKPYLRQMSSMTDEEEGRYNLLQGLSHLAEQHWTADDGNVCRYSDAIDFLNAHNFDYRGLIEAGLALEAPEGMYNFK